MIENIKLSKFKIIFKNVFFMWGIISALGLIVIILLMISQFTYKDQIDKATKNDVRFVLNWSGLDSDRIQEVTHSYSSSVSFTGDHLDAYAIKISNVSLDELNKSNDFGNQWYRGDKLPKNIDDAVSDIGAWRHYINWFPSEEEMHSEKIYVWASSVYYHGVRPTAYDIILIRPADNMVFYISTKQ